jgi:importin subunit alpha-1
MNGNGKKDFFSNDKVDQYVKKKREELITESRKLIREESVMKKRKEKLNIPSKEIEKNPISKTCSLENKLNFKNQLITFDFEKKLSTIVKIRKMLSVEKNPPIQEIIDSNILPILIQNLDEEKDVQLKFEIAWILTNIASGTSDQTFELIKIGAIPILTKLIQENNENLVIQCVWALGNIAGDSSRCREYLLKTNLIDVLLDQINNNKSLSFLRNAVWTLSNLCREKPGLKKVNHSSVILALGRLIFSEDPDILTDVCWTLSYISDGSSDIIQAIINSGFLTRITELLVHTDTRVQAPALRTLGNIVTGDDSQTQAVINCSALPCLLVLLNSNKKSIKREACWTISNITAGNVSQIQAIIDAQIFPVVVNLLDSSDSDIKKEAAWVISNATTGGKKEQIDYLIRLNSVPSLIKLLDSTDVRIIKVILEGIENILKIGEQSKASYRNNPYISIIEQADGLGKIENLQQHPNDEIYENAIKILERYFGAEEDILTEDILSEPDKEDETLTTDVCEIQIPECTFKNLNSQMDEEHD